MSTIHHFDLSVDMAVFSNYRKKDRPSVKEYMYSNEQFLDIMSKLNTTRNYKLPVIQCDNFDSLVQNKLVFHNFLTKFNNVTGNEDR